MPSPDDPAPGLRKRKKARTRAAIQRHALRLFREQGYEATTVSQIAEAAEISESTFFRYFSNKEDVVLWDDLDPRIAEAFRAQPAGHGPVRALRGAIRDVVAEIPAVQRAELRQRMALVMSIPPLRALGADQAGGPARMLAELLAERAGRSPGDPDVRALAGAVIGVCLSAMLEALASPDADMISLMDEAMARLEAGLPV